MTSHAQVERSRDARRFTVNDDGTVYFLAENEPPVEDDWGYGVPLTAADVLAGALRFLSEALLADGIVLERGERT